MSLPYTPDRRLNDHYSENYCQECGEDFEAGQEQIDVKLKDWTMITVCKPCKDHLKERNQIIEPINE